MKRCMTFMLAFIMVMGSMTSFAAPGDIIHTGNKKVYKPDSQELVDDIINGADLDKFYKEVETNDGSRKFINIVDEENKQFEYIEQLVKDNNLTSPEELATYLKNNETKINNEFKNITDEISKPFDGIVDTDKGSLDDYFGSSKAPILKTPENYSTPVPGYADGTTKIVNLTLPKGANSWIYKLDGKEFTDLGIDTIVEGTKYNSGTDIKIEAGKHLLLGAVDSAGKLKAYASIKILDNMIKKPRVELKPDLSINPTLSPAVNHSGATKVSGDLGDGSWKISVLDKAPKIVYEDSKFNEVMEYKDGMEIVVANDSELDKGLEDFEKYMIIYDEKDGKIIRYTILNIEKDNVSSSFNAPKLKLHDNYSTPTTGDSAGTTKIVTLNLPEGASKWMYAMVDTDLIVPKLDRVYADSKPYEAGQSIKVSVGDYLMILATDNGGKVRAYNIITVEADMIKNPLATELRETTHYTKPVKGTATGSTQFGFLKYDGVSSWKYKFINTVTEAPELGSELTDGEVFTLTDNKVDNMSIESNSNKLKEDNFRRYMMIYGLDSSGKVMVYKNFIMNDTNVKMPDAGILLIDAHYFGNTKGNNPNTTRFGSLAATGVPGTSLKFKYKVVDNKIDKMEFNEIISGTYDLRANVDIPVTVGKHLLILVVDGSNKTKAFTTIPLTFDNVKAGNATLLQPITNYVGPVPGGGNNSTKFTFLNEDSKFVYKLGDTSFGIPESGSVVEGGIVVKQGDDITGNDNKSVAANKYLLLLEVKEEDSKYKVIAYREFRLLDNQVKGGDGTLLVPGAYGLIPGDKPSTTRLKLEPLGLENPNSIIWRYKLVSDETYKPYFNEIVDGTTPYSVNSTTKIGPDIVVEKKADKDYGKILILATDSSSRTKAYAYVSITDGHVKEHAPEIKENLELIDGVIIDSVKFKDLTDPTVGNSYKHLISNTRPATPAIGDSLPNGVVDYTKDENITVNIGKYLSLYEVDKDNKIVKFSSIEVTKVKQGTATLVLTSPTDLVEGNIVNGGPKLTITLTGAKWADLANDKSARDKLFNGFKADSQVGEWTKVVNSMITDGKGGISISTDVDKNILTILLPETPSYDIKEEQIISLTIPFEAIEGALNPIVVKETITIKPTVKATISGDIVSGVVRQADIEAGGKTIVIDLADGAWAHDVSGIIDGFSSSGTQWSTIAGAIANGKIVRNSSSKVTITLPPVTGVDFGTTTEVISLTIPKELIQGTTENVVASPKFSLYPNMITVKANALGGKDTITLMAPDYRIIDTTNDTWIIEVSQGKLNEIITDKDLIITGLPRGLVANVSKVNGQNQIQIKLTGTASATLASDTTVKIKIKGTAATEPNSVDSEEIGLKLVRGISMMEDLAKVKVNVEDNKLTNTSVNMEYSLDSTNGTNGTWSNATAGTETVVNGGFKAGKVYVRDKDNIKVFHLVATLSHPKTPTGISISEVNYDVPGEMKVKLGLDDSTKYEYSLDGGKNWMNNPDISTGIALSENSDLRVRLKATVDSLPSLPTNKINVLDLSKVKMNVGEGKLTGTTAQMQYSLDDGTTFTNARAGETTGIKFTEGEKVIIREITSQGNDRELGTVAKKDDPISNTISFDILNKTITPATGTLQYKIVESDPWKDLNIDTKVDFKPGQLQFRTKGSETHLPSNSITSNDFIISNPKSAPELTVDDFNKDISHWDGGNHVKLENSHILQYKIDDGNWKDGKDNWANDKKTDLIKNGNPKISVRVKATKEALPSEIKVVNFTGNLTFSDVEINVLEGKIKGTTIAMQYGTSPTDGKNINWLDAKAGNTAVQFVKGMRVYIREKSKIANSQELTDEKGIAVEEDIKTTDIDYDISAKEIKNTLDRILEYRFNNEQAWNIIDRSGTVTNIEFKPGKLEIRARATEKTLPSPSIFIDIKAKASAPSLSYNDVTYEIESIGDSNGNKYEYSINGGTWTPGATPTQFEGGNTVNIRLVAGKETLPSQEQTIKFTPNLDLTNVILNAGKSQLENTSNLMEYRTISTNGEEGTWTSITKTPTELKLQPGTKVYVREKAKPGNVRGLTENAIGKKHPIQVGVLGKINYNILQSTISITSTDLNDQKIINDLQYRVNNNNWVNVDYVKLDQTTPKVLAYNVDFVPGNLEFRLKGDMDNLPSDPVSKVSIKAKASAPDVSVGFDKVNYRNKVNEDTTKMEYSFSANGPWIDGTHLDDENLVGTVYIRTKATDSVLPSSIKELTFTPVLNLKTINLSTHVDPHELNGTTKQMQYRITLNNNTDTGWITCDDGNTVMPIWLKDSIGIKASFEKLEIRDSKQHANTFTVYPE